MITKFKLILIIIVLSSSLAFAFSSTSSNYTMTQVRVVIASGQAASSIYSIEQAEIGRALAGKSESASFSLSATNIETFSTSDYPHPPLVNPVTTPTTQSSQTLTGTKGTNASIYINGYLAVPQDDQTTWSYAVTLEEGDNFFIITSCDQEGRESDSVLVTITRETGPVLSISVSTYGWDLGGVRADSTITMGNSERIVVTNDGGVAENFTLSLNNPSDWQAASQAGPERYVLNAAFSSQVENIAWDETDHQVGPMPVTCTETRFAGDQTGINVSPGDNRNLFLQFKSPTKTKTKEGQTITLTISCELPAR
ncbi:hypothetical protein ACFL1I_04550 [Candidatus Omnitrophota bacterium]